ncbi:MAG TPA: alpha/beta fold hydrolase [Chloroflexota bacterium]|nr:alpha/beta fold hydrolase [Chloroflexota bacterium]
MPVTSVCFPPTGHDALLLEGELWLPDGAQVTAGVVVAHPNPDMGGSMHNNVVAAICQGLHEANLASLRFNFRGVGGSTGRRTNGADEPKDLLGALAFLAAQPGITRVGLAGYSFGGRVALAAVREAPDIAALLCVAPPLRDGLPTRDPFACPMLVVVGDRDRLVEGDAEAYAGRLPDPSCLRIVPGADHFWLGFEPVLIEIARDFFGRALPSPDAAAAQ